MNEVTKDFPQENRQLWLIQVFADSMRDVLEEGGRLPVYDDPADKTPASFVHLMQQYTGERVKTSELEELVDLLSPAFPNIIIKWK